MEWVANLDALFKAHGSQKADSIVIEILTE
jgi:hypothetical protein